MEFLTSSGAIKQCFEGWVPILFISCALLARAGRRTCMYKITWVMRYTFLEQFQGPIRPAFLTVTVWKNQLAEVKLKAHGCFCVKLNFGEL